MLPANESGLAVSLQATHVVPVAFTDGKFTLSDEKNKRPFLAKFTTGGTIVYKTMGGEIDTDTFVDGDICLVQLEEIIEAGTDAGLTIKAYY